MHRGRRRSAQAAAAGALVVALAVLLPGLPVPAASTRSATLVPAAVVGPQCSGAPTFSINATPVNGTAPLLVHFASTISGGCPPFEFEWEFGDGAEGGGSSPSHTYYGAGRFYAQATAVGLNLSRASASVVIDVKGGSGTPVVHVAALPASGSAPLAVQAWANVTGGNVSDSTNVSWTFGDGGVGAGAFVTHVYVSPGNFTMTATVHPTGLPAARGTTRVSVLPSGVGTATVLTLTATPGAINVPGNVTITASVTVAHGPYELVLCPGDQTGCGPVNTSWSGAAPFLVVHRYTQPGNFSVGATILWTNGTIAGGASAVVVASAAQSLSLSASDSTNDSEAPADATFLATVLGGTPPYSIQWEFGDGQYGSSIAGISVSHTYQIAGTFTPRVSVRDAGGNQLNQTLAALTVHPGPTAGALPPSYLGVPTEGLLAVLLLATLGVAIAYGRWYRRRARLRRLRNEGEEIVRELEAAP